MIRVLLTGNSHALPLLEYFKTEPADVVDHCEITTFVAPGGLFKHLTTDARGQFGVTDPKALAPEDLAQIETLNKGVLMVDPAAYDVVVLMSPGMGQEDIAKTLAAHDVLHLFEAGRGNRIPQELFDTISARTIADLTRNQHWSGLVSDRLIVVERPLRSSVCIGYKRPRDQYFAMTGRLGVSCRAAFQRHSDTVAEAFAKLGVQFQPQPSGTFDETGLTAAEYSRGVARLVHEGEYPEGDAMHMNGDYGRILWADLRESVLARAAARAQA